jgi:hypothetical protein
MRKSLDKRKALEAVIWSTGLFAVAMADPFAPPLIDACLFKAVGFPLCPGCGLGHAVGFMARGEFLLSIESHPFAIAVVAVLSNHILSLVRSVVDSLQINRSDVQSYQISPRA